MNPVKDLKLSLLVLLLVVSLGAAGYMVIEEWGFIDALYMTVITLAPVGFQEVHHLSDNGRTFTILLIIVGIKKVTGKMVFNPNAHSLIEARDMLIVLGQPQAISKVESLVAGNIATT
jgi:voltage-gated potassium channel